MTRLERFKITACLYFNYFVHGMGIVILAQNMTVLSRHWHTDDAGVSLVIFSLGIGRLLVLYIAGNLSDRFGRSFFIKLGIVTYMLFFIGIVLSHTIPAAYVCGIFAGMANSFLDSGTYPALMELYPKNQASANILIKAFASIGELILPIFVAVLSFVKLWYGWSFIFCAVAMAISLVFLRNVKLNNPTQSKPKKVEKATPVAKPKTSKRNLFLGIILTIFGYISMATFYLISQWLTKYGSEVVNLNMVHARLLVSIYSVGSIIGVVISAILVERFIRPVWFMLFDTTVSLIALIAMSLLPIPGIMYIGSFVIGASAASGVMQIGLTVMSNLFPATKGRITGIYNTAGGLASFTIPVFTAFISKTSIHNIMWFDVGIAVIGVLCSIIVFIVLKNGPQNTTEKLV
ncbi:MFS transporter [Secundilactobacillus malefermentans]|uniref:MFS transporter n=1 Tax=Secundilactobacillus malefermentans TaxID=176292 RepID=UPI0011C7A4A7|nr:MFS transporter [Secundilactobacillus malefermentans]QEA31219.1 MFS transporter [Secundilactobacillus malefermentans]